MGSVSQNMHIQCIMNTHCTQYVVKFGWNVSRSNSQHLKHSIHLINLLNKNIINSGLIVLT